MADGMTQAPHAGAIAEVAAILGDRLVVTQADRAHHGQNETDFPATPPDAVAYPETTQEVSRIMAICNAARCPVTPYGAGSALEGQHLAQAGGISLDLSRMNGIVGVNAEDLNVVVQPGLRRVALNEELRTTGLFFPVDPGADATMGGMAATRASGTTAVRYGTMRDNILALEAVMADGTVIRTGTRARKSSTGYDLTNLLIGSEGTLGVITELTLKLQGVPEAVTAATCRFDSVEDAVNCVILTVQSGLPMARIELVDEVMVQGFNLYADAGLPETPHLFLEFSGSPASVAEQVAQFEDIAADFGAEGWKTATRTEDRNALWALRHGAHYACQALAGPARRVRSTDVCVPISRLAEAVTTAQRLAREGGLTVTIVGHVGDGNFHCGVAVDPDDPASVAQVAEFSHTLAHLALDLGGTVSGEHGIGMGKLDLMAREHGPALAYMRAIKAAFDPMGILNPGKLVPPAPETEIS